MLPTENNFNVFPIDIFCRNYCDVKETLILRGVNKDFYHMVTETILKQNYSSLLDCKKKIYQYWATHPFMVDKKLARDGTLGLNVIERIYALYALTLKNEGSFTYFVKNIDVEIKKLSSKDNDEQAQGMKWLTLLAPLLSWEQVSSALMEAIRFVDPNKNHKIIDEFFTKLTLQVSKGKVFTIVNCIMKVCFIEDRGSSVMAIKVLSQLIFKLSDLEFYLLFAHSFKQLLECFDKPWKLITPSMLGLTKRMDEQQSCQVFDWIIEKKFLDRIDSNALFNELVQNLKPKQLDAIFEWSVSSINEEQNPRSGNSRRLERNYIATLIQQNKLNSDQIDLLEQSKDNFFITITIAQKLFGRIPIKEAIDLLKFRLNFLEDDIDKLFSIILEGIQDGPNKGMKKDSLKALSLIAPYLKEEQLQKALKSDLKLIHFSEEGFHALLILTNHLKDENLKSELFEMAMGFLSHWDEVVHRNALKFLTEYKCKVPKNIIERRFVRALEEMKGNEIHLFWIAIKKLTVLLPYLIEEQKLILLETFIQNNNNLYTKDISSKLFLSLSSLITKQQIDSILLPRNHSFLIFIEDFALLLLAEDRLTCRQLHYLQKVYSEDHLVYRIAKQQSYLKDKKGFYGEIESIIDKLKQLHFDFELLSEEILNDNLEKMNLETVHSLNTSFTRLQLFTNKPSKLIAMFAYNIFQNDPSPVQTLDLTIRLTEAVSKNDLDAKLYEELNFHFRKDIVMVVLELLTQNAIELSDLSYDYRETLKLLMAIVELSQREKTINLCIPLFSKNDPLEYRIKLLKKIDFLRPNIGEMFIHLALDALQNAYVDEKGYILDELFRQFKYMQKLFKEDNIIKEALLLIGQGDFDIARLSHVNAAFLDFVDFKEERLKLRVLQAIAKVPFRDLDNVLAFSRSFSGQLQNERRVAFIECVIEMDSRQLTPKIVPYLLYKSKGYKFAINENKYLITIEKEALKNHSLEILNDFCNLLYKKQVYDLDVKFIGENGIDSGGLSRHFISELLVGIKKTLRFEEYENGLAFPKLHYHKNGSLEIHNEKERLVYYQLGVLFQFCLNAEKNLPTGLFLDISFFIGLRRLIVFIDDIYDRTSDEMIFNDHSLSFFLDINNVHAPAMNKILELVKFPNKVNRSDPKQLQEMLSSVAGEDEIIQLKIDDQNVEQIIEHLPIIQKVLIDQMIERAKQTLIPLIHIARGMRKAHHQRSLNWEKIYDMNPDEISKRLQGELSSEIIIEKLVFEKTIPEKIQKWLIQWILDADERKIKQFLFSISGSYALGSNTSVSLQIKKSDSNFRSHTCSFTMALPIQMMTTEEEFNSILEFGIGAQEFSIG